MIKAPRENPQELLTTVETFLARCRRPAALEYGEEPIPLAGKQYSLEVRSGRLAFEIWDEERCLSRRISAIERCSAGLLDCTVERFGGKTGKLTFLDLERPQAARRSVTAVKEHFAEKFRRILSRQFPGWQIPVLSAGLDLQRSFSSVYPRALLRRGRQTIAAVACPNAPREAGMLTYALLWHSHIREISEPSAEVPLCLFLPHDAGTLTAHRLRWLDGTGLRYRLFLFNEHGSAGEVDPADLGNLDTRVSPAAPPQPSVDLNEMPQHVHPVRGFAPPPHTERWLEHAVRSHLALIDPHLLAQPVHSQVLSFAAQDRDSVDLLAATPSGRLAVLELKVSEDIHLPLQALDYWMRVRWHAERRELGHLFPNLVIDPQPPKLFLVAPALSFHPATDTLLQYFSPDILVERVGVNTGWQEQFKVVLRLRGAESPMSQQPGHHSNNL